MQSGSTLNRHQVDRRVLASSIDFKVEFKLVAFVQFPQARTFNSADVHESVGLAVIARDEAEAFHRVEELDRARGALTRQLALWCSRLCSNRDDIANNLQIGSRNLPAAINEVEFQRLTFSETFQACTLHSADVDEHVLAPIFARNEAEALLAIEKLYDTLTSANDLGWHTAATTTAARATKATTAGASATEAAATTAAEAAAVTTAKAATAAVAAAAIAATEAAAITAAKAATVTKTAAAKTAATAAVGIKAALVAKTVALVSAATAPPSVKTHRNQ